MVCTYLKELKANNKVKNNITLAEWSQLSGVPVVTISKYISNQTKNPNFQSVCDLILALGGSVDAALGISTGETNPTVLAAQAETALAYREVIQCKDDIIEKNDEVIKSKDQIIAKLKKQMFICLGIAGVGVLVALYFIWDATHGGLGLIRY